MLPLCIGSGILLILFVVLYFRKELRKPVSVDHTYITVPWDKKRRIRRIAYLVLFALILFTIVSRIKYWPIAVLIVILTVALVNIRLFLSVDYVLLVTFLCFFIFSSSVAANPSIGGFLKQSVAGNEYWWVIGLSQIISNVPASIVLFPFTENTSALIYGADTAGLCSLIGSLASVINYRIYVREYPENGGKFLKTFMLISLIFFAIVVIPGYFISKYMTW